MVFGKGRNYSCSLAVAGGTLQGQQEGGAGAGAGRVRSWWEGRPAGVEVMPGPWENV